MQYHKQKFLNLLCLLKDDDFTQKLISHPSKLTLYDVTKGLTMPFCHGQKKKNQTFHQWYFLTFHFSNFKLVVKVYRFGKAKMEMCGTVASM